MLFQEGARGELCEPGVFEESVALGVFAQGGEDDVAGEEAVGGGVAGGDGFAGRGAGSGGGVWGGSGNGGIGEH